MNKIVNRCNILIYGTLSSGSSAVHNLLKEYDNIGYFEEEFDYYRAPGLVDDQLNDISSTNFPNKIDKINRQSSFTKKIFFKSLIWKFIFNCIPKKYLEIDYDLEILNYIKKGLIGYYQVYLLKRLNKNLKSAIPYENKIEISKKWIKAVGDIFSNKKEIILFDQPINLTSDVTHWTTIFNPYKLIIVYRDPRDQIADIIKRGLLFLPYGSLATNLAGVNIDYIYGRNRKGAIRFQIDAIKIRLSQIDYLENLLGTDKLLLIDFEGFIINRDKYISIVEDFIGGIKDHHKFQNKYFNSIVSKTNIGIYKEYLDEDELNELTDLQNWYSERKGMENIIQM